MTRLSQSELLEGLAHIVGDAHLSTRQPDRIAYSADFWPRSQIWKLGGDVQRYPPDCIVWPDGEEQVAAVLRFCNAHRIPVIPYGAGSGVCGGTVPLHGGVIVDVKRMNRLLAVDASSMLVRAQAGINGQLFEDRLNARGVTLGHFPSSIMCSTLGGWLACRSAGQFSSRYGKIEDMVTSLRVVFPDGTALDTADRAPGGPDWTQLVVGSEGTLGLITEAELKVNPLPEARSLRGWRFRQLTDGFQAMRMLMQAGLKPMVLRLYDPFDTLMALGKDAGGAEEVTSADELRAALAPAEASHPVEGGRLTPFVKRLKRGAMAAGLSVPGLLNRVVHSVPASCLLIVGFEGPREAVRDDMWRAGRLLSEAGGTDAGAAIGNAWLEHRYRVSFKAAKIYEAGAFVDTMEVATTWDRLEGLYKGVVRAMSPHALIMAHFSHAYREGASIYFTFAAYRRDARRAEQSYDRAWQAGLDAVHAAGATASHHHGVGLLKKYAMPAEHGEMLRVWRAMKGALDPANIMNPGKLFPEATGGLP